MVIDALSEDDLEEIIEEYSVAKKDDNEIDLGDFDAEQAEADRMLKTQQSKAKL